MGPVYCCAPPLIAFQNWPLWIAKSLDITLLADDWVLNFFGWWYQIFPFKTLAFDLRCTKALFLFVLNVWLISAPGTPSAHKNWIIARCYSLMHTERAPLQWQNWLCKVKTPSPWHKEFMLVAALAMSSADNTTKFKKYTVDSFWLTLVLYNSNPDCLWTNLVQRWQPSGYCAV
jgi:hypothetical protein